MTDYLELETNTDNLLLESSGKLVLEGLTAVKSWFQRNMELLAIIIEEEE